MKTPEALQAYIQNFIQKDRMGALVGAQFSSLTAEECRYEYDVTPEHFNPNGNLHGGALFTVMDSSQGMFVHFLLTSPDRAAATGTATIKYLAPVQSGRISIRTWITRREGRKLFICSEACDASGKKVAILDEIWITLKSAPISDTKNILTDSLLVRRRLLDEDLLAWFTNNRYTLTIIVF